MGRHWEGGPASRLSCPTNLLQRLAAGTCRAVTLLHPELVQVGKYPLSTMFGMCSCFLLICFACQRQFALLVHQELAGSHFDEDQRLRAEAELAKIPDSDPATPDSQAV